MTTGTHITNDIWFQNIGHFLWKKFIKLTMIWSSVIFVFRFLRKKEVSLIRWRFIGIQMSMKSSIRNFEHRFCRRGVTIFENKCFCCFDFSFTRFNHKCHFYHLLFILCVSGAFIHLSIERNKEILIMWSSTPSIGHS